MRGLCPRATPSLPLLALLALTAACTFRPDLSRFPACGPDGTCDVGSTCLEPERICLPDCGEGEACREVVLVEEPLPPGVEGQPYAHTLQAHGGTPPYTFRTVEPLPPGLSLDAGTLSGTLPTFSDVGVLTGTDPYTRLLRFTVEVEDEAAPRHSDSHTYEVPVRARLALAGPGTLASARVGRAYEETLLSTGGTPPYTYSLADGGTQPVPGLTLTPDGRLTGTPSRAETVGFAVRVRDSAQPPQEDVRTLSLTVAAFPDVLLPLAITTQQLPAGRVGMPFEYTLRGEGGTGAYAWVVKDAPPNTLSLVDWRTGLLQGTPRQPVDANITVELRDGLDTLEVRTLVLHVE